MRPHKNKRRRQVCQGLRDSHIAIITTSSHTFQFNKINLIARTVEEKMECVERSGIIAKKVSIPLGVNGGETFENGGVG